ncbi:hypothetical protein ACTXT7_016056 [Hymenolepis weldensis]
MKSYSPYQGILLSSMLLYAIILTIVVIVQAVVVGVVFGVPRLIKEYITIRLHLLHIKVQHSVLN